MKSTTRLAHGLTRKGGTAQEEDCMEVNDLDLDVRLAGVEVLLAVLVCQDLDVLLSTVRKVESVAHTEKVLTDE